MKALRSTVIILGFAFVISAVTVFFTSVSNTLAAVFITAILFALIVAIKPEAGMFAFLGMVLIFEEFPIGSVESERSMRTPIYAQSTFIRGLYLMDILLIGLLFVILLHLLMKKKSFDITRHSTLSVPLGALVFLMVVSCSLTFMSNPNFMNDVYDISRVGFTMKTEAAAFIAFAHLKAFIYIFGTFIASLLIFDTKKRIISAFYFILAAISVNLLQGLVRFMGNPSEFLANISPLFYDSASSLFFSVFVILMLSLMIMKVRNEMIFRMAGIFFISLAFVCIAFSFRRAVWGGFITAIALFPLFLPKRTRIIFFTCVLVLVVIAVPLSLLTGKHDAAFKAIEGRIAQTTLSESSTTYRIALYSDMAERISTIPLFGYGLLPLWNFPIQWRTIYSNLENVHSIYLWLILRFGILGLICFLWYLFRMLKHSFRVYFNASDNLDKSMGITIFLAYVMIIIIGVLNPIYGEIRYMVFMGVLTGILSNMLALNRQGKVLE